LEKVLQDKNAPRAIRCKKEGKVLGISLDNQPVLGVDITITPAELLLLKELKAILNIDEIQLVRKEETNDY
jgi:hypothetical protein